MAVARLLLLVSVGMAIAPGTAVAADPPNASNAPVKERKICREAERITGSRIRTRRQCHTAEEWQREDEARNRLPLSLSVTEGQGDGLPVRRPQ
jgi:hypothetical protein